MLAAFPELQKSAVDLALKYEDDLNPVEISDEIASFKMQAMSILPNDTAASSEDLLKILYEYGLVESYPNLEVALRLFLTIPVSVASGERSFSKLKMIKNYLRSTLGQENLTNMAILSIEQALSKTINYDTIIDEFASLKSKKSAIVNMDVYIRIIYTN